MTTLEQLKSERRELLAHQDNLNADKRYLRTQIDLNAHHSDIKAAYSEKLTRVNRAWSHAEQRLRALNDEIKHENIRLEAARSKPKKAA